MAAIIVVSQCSTHHVSLEDRNGSWTYQCLLFLHAHHVRFRAECKEYDRMRA